MVMNRMVLPVSTLECPSKLSNLCAGQHAPRYARAEAMLATAHVVHQILVLDANTNQ